MIPKTVKKKGNINRYGAGITIFVNKDSDVHSWWWVKGRGWVTDKEAGDAGQTYSSHFEPCRTIRAYRRHVRKHCGHIKNADIVWVQRHGNHANIKV